MKAGDIRALIKVRRPEPDPVRRRLRNCHDIADLRAAARRLTPRPVFDYVDGGSDEEIALRANAAAFRRWRFVPRALGGHKAPGMEADILGRTHRLPLLLGPTGYTRMMHQGGELAAARSAHRHDLPYTLSTMATTTIEDVARAAPGADLWFQLYIQRDDGLNKELLARAADAGYRVLMVTVDTMVPGHRIRDERNGLVIPPALTPSTLASIAARPGYWLRMLRGPAIGFANFPSLDAKTIAGSASLFEPSIGWDAIATVRERWSGPLILKGPLSPADAGTAIEAGVDGVLLSNHGGRQLDRAVAPIDLLPGVRARLGPDVPVLVDSGVRHGADIAVALALGADAVAIGRAYLYGLMAGGETGVDHALELLEAEFTRTLHLLGAAGPTDLDPSMLREGGKSGRTV
ncbi:MAG TPA: alpha-hydroxy acid oxidase [Streptosporangiaceae bacterium]|nr:alpha-hydroxy acid oxidase [Streptosporangiaceae bacterium]